MTKQKLSYVRKYFLRMQDERVGFMIALPCASFVTVAAWIENLLNAIALMMIWTVLLPAIMLIFRCFSLLSAKYRDVSSKLMLYSGSYEDLIIKLFNEGFRLQSKIDNYLQFRSDIAFTRAHVLIVKQEGEQYSILGSAEIITALSKDTMQDDLKIDVAVVDADAKIKKEGGDNNLKVWPMKKKFSAKKRNINT